VKEPISYETRKSVYNKIITYIFNPDHEEGWPKGRWFMFALGFNPENPDHVKMLAKQIYFDSVQAVFKGTTQYGEVYKLVVCITGPNGKTVNGIRTVWQKDRGANFIRLVTVYPPKKKVKPCKIRN
jgi:hypothetical protein